MARAQCAVQVQHRLGHKAHLQICNAVYACRPGVGINLKLPLSFEIFNIRVQEQSSKVVLQSFLYHGAGRTLSPGGCRRRRQQRQTNSLQYPNVNPRVRA